MRIHRRGVVGAILLAAALVLAACGSGDDARTTDGPTTSEAPGAGNGATIPDGPAISIGAQDFGESAVLAEVYAQALTAAGYEVSIQPLGGFRDLVLASFESGDINFTPEYGASMLEFLNEQKGEATGDAEETTELLRGYLEELDLVAYDPSPAVDTNGFVVTAEVAQEHGLGAISDMAGMEQDLTLGGPPDCETNPFCIPGLMSVYGIDFSQNFTPLDAGSVTEQALAAGEIDVAILFSTNPAIAERGWVLLEDDQSMLAADNVVPVLTSEVDAAYGEDFRALVDEVSAALTTEALTEMNRQHDLEARDADEVAAEWLQENGFISG